MRCLFSSKKPSPSPRRDPQTTTTRRSALSQMGKIRASTAGSDASSSISDQTNSHRQRRHPASLIPRHLHDPRLLGLLKARVNDELIEHVAECTLAVVATSVDPVQLPTPPTTPVKLNLRRNYSRCHKEPRPVDATTKDDGSMCDLKKASTVPSLTTFIKLTAARSNAQAPTLLVTLVYLDRLRRRLTGAKAAKGMQCTYHRLFLACLIGATKYCCDCCPGNIHWVKWSGLFTLKEINLMEQEFLMLLDHQLRVEEDSLIAMCTPFLSQSSTGTITALQRQALSAMSCHTPCSSSTGSQEGFLTPLPSPLIIWPASRNTRPSSQEAERKRFKLCDSASCTRNTAITRAKSWYGNLRIPAL